MLERISAILTHYSTASSFLRLIKTRYAHDPEGRRLILRALCTALEAHEGSSRLEGKAVVSQPIAVAVLLCEALSIEDPTVIAAALLHLFIEEVPGWDFERLCSCFGFEVAMHVRFSSKETSEDEANWEMRTTLAHYKLLHAPSHTQMLKLCDRFNNLLSISALPLWKQKRMIKDTIAFYVPLSLKLGVFVEELQEAIIFASKAD